MICDLYNRTNKTENLIDGLFQGDCREETPRAYKIPIAAMPVMKKIAGCEL
jgi:hypothetical protein